MGNWSWFLAAINSGYRYSIHGHYPVRSCVRLIPETCSSSQIRISRCSLDPGWMSSDRAVHVLPRPCEKSWWMQDCLDRWQRFWNVLSTNEFFMSFPTCIPSIKKKTAHGATWIPGQRRYTPSCVARWFKMPQSEFLHPSSQMVVGIIWWIVPSNKIDVFKVISIKLSSYFAAKSCRLPRAALFKVYLQVIR